MMNSHSVKRIEDVTSLRGRQFAEDAGPMSHPIRPDSYISSKCDVLLLSSFDRFFHVMAVP